MKSLVKPLGVFAVYILLLIVLYAILPTCVWLFSGFDTSSFTDVSQSPLYAAVFIFVVPATLGAWMHENLHK